MPINDMLQSTSLVKAAIIDEYGEQWLESCTKQLLLLPSTFGSTSNICLSNLMTETEYYSGGGKESLMARSVSLWYVMLSTNSLSILQYFFATHELPTSAPILGICASDFTTQATYGKVKELEWQEVIRNTIVVTLWVYHCNNSLSSVKVDAAYVTMYCIAIWIDESLGFFCLRKVTP